MPFPSLNRGAKRKGIQTHAAARKLPERLLKGELEYLNIRDWYCNQLAVKAQFDEALAQAKAANNYKDIVYFGGRINSINGTLVDVKERVREAGARSWAEAFLLAAECMLDSETRKALSMQADALLGRDRHEFKKGD